jgi:hypothetical protein
MGTSGYFGALMVGLYLKGQPEGPAWTVGPDSQARSGTYSLCGHPP